MKEHADDVSVRLVDPAGWPWTVRRRWLPWRPHKRWTVEAHGRRTDGMRVRYRARADRWAATALSDAVAAEIRATGVPGSLGEPTVERVPATERLRATLGAGGEVTVPCLVQGYGAARSRDGWIEGRLTAVTGTLSFRTGDGLTPATWSLLGSDDPHVALAGVDDHAAVGMRVVASYGTSVGRFRVAVDPHLGPLLGDLLAAGVSPLESTQQAWAMWRQDDAGAVREIARFGSRADAELLAESLAARGSRQNFWLAAAPTGAKEISVASGRAVGL